MVEYHYVILDANRSLLSYAECLYLSARNRIKHCSNLQSAYSSPKPNLIKFLQASPSNIKSQTLRLIKQKNLIFIMLVLVPFGCSELAELIVELASSHAGQGCIGDESMTTWVNSNLVSHARKSKPSVYFLAI